MPRPRTNNMETLAKWLCLVVLLLASGCSGGGGTPVATSNQQLVDQFQVALEGLEKAIGRPHTSEEAEDYSDDLVSRLDKLSGIANELEFATANKSDALEAARSLSATLSELHRSAEGSPRTEVLRGKVQKLKGQIDDLKPKL